MVKSKTSKMHLEVNNDLEFDISKESTSKRNRKSKKVKSTPASTNFVVNLGSRIVNLESGDSFATFFVVPDFS